MDGSSSPASDSSPAAHGDGASRFLTHLPSRGLFTSTLLPSNPGGMLVYICDRDTSPPEDQLIKTNQTNILIRSLLLKKQKVDPSSKDTKGTAASEASRKRPAERALDDRASAKREITNTPVASQLEGSRTRILEKDLQRLTVERLRALLKEKGHSLKGKKDELIARLRGSDG